MKKGYQFGTHRALPPEETLRRVTPHADRRGVTRCADVTGLDSIGIPVFCAIRPDGGVLQVANGKGVRRIDARVSAIMEALEYSHAECAPLVTREGSVADLRAEGIALPDFAALQGFWKHRFGSEQRVVSWVPAVDLLAGTATLLPTSYVHHQEPHFYYWTTNGLASGNNLVEATLHGLYEVAERHSLSLLTEDDRVDFEGCTVIDPDSIDDEVVGPLLERIRAAGCRVALLRVALDWGIHTMLATLLDPSPYAGASRVNIGSGAHLSPTVAAARAITEAAQSRLTFIHGSREDLEREAYRGRHETLYDLFGALVGDHLWSDLADVSTLDFDTDLRLVLQTMEEFGLDRVYRCTLTPNDCDYTVVKVAVCETRMDFPL